MFKTILSSRKRITIATSFSVFSAQTQHHIFNFYQNLAEYFDIEIVSLTHTHERAFTRVIAPGLKEIQTPKSLQHQAAEAAIEEKVGTCVTDILMSQLYYLTPDYLKALKQSTAQSDFLITYQPYLFPALREVSQKPIWYEAPYVEIEQKQNILPDNKTGGDLFDLITNVEKECCQNSDLILTHSDNNAIVFNQLYNVETHKIINIPHGINVHDFTCVSEEERLKNKAKLGLQDSFIAIFTGSGDRRNFHEYRSILNIASKVPEVQFLVLGNVGLSLDSKLTPPNVSFIKDLDKTVKSLVFSIADVALNPAKSATDMTLTMLDYLVTGIPVISTAAGIKNCDLECDRQCLVVNLWQFPETIINLKNESKLSKSNYFNTIRDFITKEFSWQAIVNNFIYRLVSIGTIPYVYSLEKETYKYMCNDRALSLAQIQNEEIYIDN